MLCAAAFLLTACGKPDKKATEIPAALDAAAIGEMLFHDPSLSASGKQSCATCHSPAHAHAQPNALAVQRGGPALDQPGTRAVPSLRYLAATPAFSFDAEGTASGGFNHDGSAASLAAQAERPLLAANEMANLTRTAVVEKLRKASFTYDDYLKQMSMVKKMGSFKSILKMLPGMSSLGDLDSNQLQTALGLRTDELLSDTDDLEGSLT